MPSPPSTMTTKGSVISDSIGFSDLFPLIPLLCASSIVCCALVLPGFVKTRLFVLDFYPSWIVLGCFLIMINMCIWRNNTRDIPIYSDLVARIWDIYGITLYLSIACFNKLVWNMTRPEPSVKLYDARAGYNRLDAPICLGFPLLWSPMNFISSNGRYTINEDLGPWPAARPSLGSFLINIVPIGLAATASVVFSGLAVFNISRLHGWKHARQQSHQPPKYRGLEPAMVLKYLVMAAIGIFESTFGFLWSLQPLYHRDERSEPWFTTLKVDLRQLSLTYTIPRHEMLHAEMQNVRGFVFTLPLVGVQLFLLFGLGSELRQTYRSWLCALLNLLGLPIIYRWIKRHARRVGRSRVTNDPDNFTPFNRDDVALEPCAMAVLLTRTDGRSKPHWPLPIPVMPAPLPMPPTSSSKRTHLRGHQSLQTTSPERWRTFHKDRAMPPERWRTFCKGRTLPGVQLSAEAHLKARDSTPPDRGLRPEN